MLIVYVTPQQPEVIQSMGLPETDDAHWVQEALGISSRNLRVIRAINDPLPSFDGVNAILIGGSRYSVYDGHSWQEHLEQWIREAVARDIPFLGICYGHQALVKAFGGVVEKDPKGREFGVTTIALTDAGLGHPLFQGLPATFTLYANHADCVAQLPSGFTLLASSKDHPIQVIAQGTKIVGIQPHPEFTAEVALAFLNVRKELFLREGFLGGRVELETLIESIRRANEAATDIGRRILQNFLQGAVADHMNPQTII